MERQSFSITSKKNSFNLRITKQSISDFHITTTTYYIKKYQGNNSPCRKGTKPRTTLDYTGTTSLHITLVNKKQERKPCKRGLSLPPYSLPQNNHFMKKCLSMFSHNLSWASVFYRLRDSHSSVIEAESLYSSVTEAHSYEIKITPTRYQRRC